MTTHPENKSYHRFIVNVRCCDDKFCRYSGLISTCEWILELGLMTTEISQTGGILTR